MQPFVIDKFGGLNLVDNVSEIGLGGAIDASNVAFDYPGRVRSRDGTALFVSGTSRDFSHLFTSSADHVFAVDDTNDLMRVYDAGAAAVTTSAHTPTAGAWYVEYGGAVYYSGTSSQQVKKFAAGAITSPASLATIDGTYMALQPVDERLVIADSNGVVRFSNPGDPETFSAADFIDFASFVTGIVAWNNLLLVFQTDRFHVFYGNSTDSTGGSIFNYRTVNVGIGASATDSSAVAARDGVYFIANDGLYVTRGDVPQRVSDAIAPIWEVNGLPLPNTYNGTVTQNVSGMSLAHVNDRVYLESGTETYVLYRGQWTAYSLVMSFIARAPAVNNESLLYTASGSGNPINRMRKGLTTDSGSAIATRFQSGFYDLGSPNEKRIRETLMDGQGTANLDLRADYASSGTNVSVPMGTAPATGSGRSRSARRGRLFSHKVSASSGAWVLDRMTHHVADERGVR